MRPVRRLKRALAGFSFRTRLTLAFTAVFLIAGGVLLTSTYLIVADLFDSSATDVRVSLTSDGDQTEIRLGSGSTVTVDGADSASGIVEQTQARTRSDVLTGLLGRSMAVLAVFAALSAVVAWLMARAPLRRIARLTAATEEIATADDLDRRLALPGPRDEITALGDAIDTMLARLSGAFEAQDRFIANASHELRTPLATARTALEIPLAQGRVPDDLTPAVQRALRAHDRSEQLIGALLDLARSRAIRPATDTAARIAPLIRHALDERSDLIRDRDLRVTTVLADDAAVLGEPVLLSQLVANLVDNAIRHNAEHGTIDVGLAIVDDEIVLELFNTGPLLPYEDVARLVEPFNRGTGTRSSGSGGIGLGLSLVAAIVARHHGSLTLTAREGGGLDVTVRLPYPASSPV